MKRNRHLFGLPTIILVLAAGTLCTPRLRAQCSQGFYIEYWDHGPSGYEEGYLPKFTDNWTGDVILSTIYQNNQGKVGISTTSPSRTLTINGDFQATDSTINATENVSYSRIYENIGVAVTNPDRRMVVNGTCKATKFLTASDARLKENIAPIRNALSKVCSLRGVKFNLVENPEEERRPVAEIGFIAQEVEPFVPEVVYDDSEGYKSVAYTRLVPLIIEAVKEQQQLISRIEKDIQELKERARNR